MNRPTVALIMAVSLLSGFALGWYAHKAKPVPLRISTPVIRENRALLQPNGLEYRPEGKVVWL